MSDIHSQDSCRITLEREVCVDVSVIPAFRRRELAQCVLESVKQAMRQPGAEEELRELRLSKEIPVKDGDSE